jgi:hypothetical protein
MTIRIIVCDGATKSGSTLLFRITEAIFGDSVEFLNNLFSAKDSDMIEYYEGIPTGYVHNPLGLLDIVNDKCEALFTTGANLVIKTHGFSLYTAMYSHGQLNVIHLYTLRNPYDNIKSLLDASAKEVHKREAGIDYRAEFAALNTVDIAGKYLLTQYQFAIANAKSNRLQIIEYPDYMSPRSSAFDKYCDILKLDASTVQKACLDIDSKSRSGQIWTEFNVGSAGRGEGIKREIDQSLLAEISHSYDALQLLARS